MPEPVHPKRNRILAHLRPNDFGLLEPHLEHVQLDHRLKLEVRDRRIEHVYFLESGIASVVTRESHGPTVEVGVIGQEGMTGLPFLLGTDRTPLETFMQVAGSGQRITVDAFRLALEKSRSLHFCCLQFVHVFMIQISRTSLANARAKLEERLARWLLLARDRASDEELPITHEFLALMLGVRRAGVTTALGLLEERGLIETRRGHVVILDREGLEQLCEGFYGVPEAEFRRLFG